MAIIAVLESTFGWVTGCAWTNFVRASLDSLDEYPTATVFFLDLIYSIAVTCVMFVWLVWKARFDGDTKDETASEVGESGDREYVERYFLTTSMCYFVGWCYITLIRDLTTVLAVALRPNDDTINFLGECVLLGLFALVITLPLIKFSSLSLRTYGRAAAGGQPGHSTVNPMNFLSPPLGNTHVHVDSSVVLPTGRGPREPLHHASPPAFHVAIHPADSAGVVVGAARSPAEVGLEERCAGAPDPAADIESR
mmetsp:Transcript_91199/g.273874  ORF Transcript_91199/g.273874 Transcript_91199/m.273874 type:complete len:252 (-) Transcript_91199:202-957(-)